jgi:hypothetical protein
MRHEFYHEVGTSVNEERKMSSTTLIRMSGLVLILAFAFSFAGGMLHPVIEGESHGAFALAHPGFPVAHLLVFLGEVFLLIGLPGLYTRIAPSTGILGLAGFALYFFANATLASFFSAYEAFVAPVLAADLTTRELVAPGGAIPASVPFAILQEVGGSVLMLGMLLLGIAVFRSRALPRWSGVLLAAAPILLLLPVPEVPIFTGLLIELPRGLAVAAMGYALFVHGRERRTAMASTEGPP